VAAIAAPVSTKPIAVVAARIFRLWAMRMNGSLPERNPKSGHHFSVKLRGKVKIESVSALSLWGDL
jgi:hypothetical protein